MKNRSGSREERRLSTGPNPDGEDSAPATRLWAPSFSRPRRSLQLALGSTPRRNALLFARSAGATRVRRRRSDRPSSRNDEWWPCAETPTEPGGADICQTGDAAFQSNSAAPRSPGQQRREQRELRREVEGFVPPSSVDLRLVRARPANAGDRTDTQLTPSDREGSRVTGGFSPCHAHSRSDGRPSGRPTCFPTNTAPCAPAQSAEDGLSSPERASSCQYSLVNGRRTQRPRERSPQRAKCPRSCATRLGVSEVFWKRDRSQRVDVSAPKSRSDEYSWRPRRGVAGPRSCSTSQREASRSEKRALRVFHDLK